MRRVQAIFTATLATLAVLTPALTPMHAAMASSGPAKTYNDPWLEGDLEQIRVPEALTILARTPQHVIVGDIDSGADLSDPDLAPHLLKLTGSYTCGSEYGPGPDYSASAADGDYGCDFIGSGTESGPTTSPDGDPTEPSTYGHGTGTAAIIAAVADNGIEGAGVAPNARLLPVRACYGNAPDCSPAIVLDGFTYAVDMGATIVNASWAPANNLGTAVQDFIHNHPKVLFDFAIAGTGQNSNPFSLCTDKTTYPNVICVGAANADDSPGTDNGDTTTDVSAPGYAGVPSATGARVEYGTTSGGATSSAAAHVSGAAALLRGIAPDLSPSMIRDILVSTSRPVSSYATANKAHGIIDVNAAVQAVQKMEGFVTPSPGQGAAADSPDPFQGQTASGGPTAPAPVAAPVPAPAAAPAPGPAAAPAPSKPAPHFSLTVGKLPRSVAAGGTVAVHVRVGGGKTSFTVKLAHGKTQLATATRHHVGGLLTVVLHIPRGAKLGKATLTVQLDATKPLRKTITVTRPVVKRVSKAR